MQPVIDPGTAMWPIPMEGKPGEIKLCPRMPHAKGADCELCGGTQLRRICNLTICHEYGCQGAGVCQVEGDGHA
ncbi:hypothetical protein D3C76_47780 [compost metagenome]